MTIKASTTRHPALTYYALVFALSWGGVLIVVGPSGFPGTGEEVERLMPHVILERPQRGRSGRRIR